MDFNTDILGWTREPEQYRIGKDKIEIVTMPPDRPVAKDILSF